MKFLYTLIEKTILDEVMILKSCHEVSYSVKENVKSTRRYWYEMKNTKVK